MTNPQPHDDRAVVEAWFQGWLRDLCRWQATEPNPDRARFIEAIAARVEATF